MLRPAGMPLGGAARPAAGRTANAALQLGPARVTRGVRTGKVCIAHLQKGMRTNITPRSIENTGLQVFPRLHADEVPTWRLPPE